MCPCVSDRNEKGQKRDQHVTRRFLTLKGLPRSWRSLHQMLRRKAPATRGVYVQRYRRSMMESICTGSSARKPFMWTMGAPGPACLASMMNSASSFTRASFNPRPLKMIWRRGEVPVYAKVDNLYLELLWGHIMLGGGKRQKNNAFILWHVWCRTSRGQIVQVWLSRKWNFVTEAQI